MSLAANGVTVYCPPSPDRANATAASVQRRAAQRAKEPPAPQDWRQRMAAPASKPIYQRRGRIEATNGILKARGLGVMLVRSLAKARCVTPLQALAHDLWRAHLPGHGRLRR